MTKSRIPQPHEIDYREKFSLDGKVVVITGGRGLIGSALVEACAQYGANVVIADLETTAPQAFAEELAKRFSRPMLGVVLDVAIRSSVIGLRDAVLKAFRKIDGLVNCHQNSKKIMSTRFEDYTDEEWQRVMDINLNGVFLTCQILGGWMAENGGGSIVNIPSLYAVVAPNQNLYPGTSIGCPAAYSASKGGVMALSQYLSTYWASKKVRVNQLTPHGVIPYGTLDKGRIEFEERFSKMTPAGRMSFNHEVPCGLVFLLSDAGSYVNGHNLIIDGGWTAW